MGTIAHMYTIYHGNPKNIQHPVPLRPLAAFAANMFSHNLVKKVVLCIESSHDDFEVFLQSRHVPCTDQKCSTTLHDADMMGSIFMHFQHHHVAPEDLPDGPYGNSQSQKVRYPTLLRLVSKNIQFGKLLFPRFLASEPVNSQ